LMPVRAGFLGFIYGRPAPYTFCSSSCDLSNVSYK
jgi:hypothetical protein